MFSVSNTTIDNNTFPHNEKVVTFTNVTFVGEIVVDMEYVCLSGCSGNQNISGFSEKLICNDGSESVVSPTFVTTYFAGTYIPFSATNITDLYLKGDVVVIPPKSDVPHIERCYFAAREFLGDVHEWDKDCFHIHVD